ncbi:MAG: TetR/AcrR family transcriptional regulator [Acidobacteriota bacterium]|nr:TetR/AcrR family transcriptional regulator [Acidobacteriota bacterium]
MGRKSLKEERSSMILDAFERCVARFGLDGTSLENIAEEAGVKRGLIRHYLGNREALIIALAERVVARYRMVVDTMLTGLPAKGRGEALLDALFPAETQSTTDDIMVMESLIAASDRIERVHRLMHDWMESYVRQIAGELGRAYPDSESEHCLAVAYGVIGIAFNHESLMPLRLSAAYATRARTCARLLVKSLTPGNRDNRSGEDK